MVIRFLIFIVCALSVSAQNYSVTFWKDVEGKPAGVPDYMPCNVRTHPIGTSTNVTPPAVLLTKEQFLAAVSTNQAAYHAALQAAKDADTAAEATKKAQRVNPRKATLAQQFDALADAEQSWGKLTDAQKLAVVRTQTRLLLELRELITELHKTKLEQEN